MDVCDTLDGFGRALDSARAGGRTVGLVPTMGALHGGHRSLVERAAAECDHVAVTIFVNPLQFGDAVDIERYPRTLDADLAICRAAGVDTVFAPAVSEMYPSWPDPPATRVSVSGVAGQWEGSVRPGHFDGVATVVAKLFSVAGRCRAYFGEKDFQQLAVVRRMVADLSMPVEIVGCPTVREEDGLAMSSRNVLLSPEQRQAADVLWRAMQAGRQAVSDGENRPAAVSEAMAAVVGDEPAAALDYAAVVTADDLSVPHTIDAAGGPFRLLLAARFGRVRLIDNGDLAVPVTAGVSGAAVEQRAVGN
jgi:pantoate--beta-alanine ligase